VRLTGIINVTDRTWFKNKTEPHSLFLDLYSFFFFAVQQEMAGCRVGWRRRRRKAGTDEVKRNKNQSKPPKEKKKTVCNNFIFFCRDFSKNKVLPRIYPDVHTHIGLRLKERRRRRRRRKKQTFYYSQRFMGSKDGGDFLRRRRRNSLNINKRI
jgi:hypothetical protein